MTASFAGTVDVAQVVMILFIGFILALFVWLRREDKREGYPLEDPADAHLPPGRRLRHKIIGWPAPPPPKLFQAMHGLPGVMPHPEGRTDLAIRPLFAFPGAPNVPTGDPMLDGVGPAAWAMKVDEPILTWEGHPLLQPLRVLPGWAVVGEDPDPRGMPVLDADGVQVGHVADLWLDHGVKILRYLEVTLTRPGSVPRAMIPIYFADISALSREIRVPALFAHNFAAFPQLQAPDTITAREEDRVSAYCAGGLLYGKPRREESVL